MTLEKSLYDLFIAIISMGGNTGNGFRVRRQAWALPHVPI